MHDLYGDEQPLPKNVFMYLRKSTDDKRIQVRSLEDQEIHCRKLAERYKLNIVEIFSEKRSAATPKNRSEFTRMMKALSYKSKERRRADAILTYSVCRLSRNPMEGGLVVQYIWDDLVKHIYFCNYPFSNHSAGREHLMTEFARACGNNQRNTDFVKRGVHSREERGAMVYPSKFGYIKRREFPSEPKQCSLFPIPHPEEFPIIKTVFELALAGYSLSEISLKLQKRYPESGSRFPRATLSRWLHDPFYYGQWMVNAGKPNERQYDLRELAKPLGLAFTPAIAEPLFRQVQARLSGRRASSRDYHAKRLPNPFPQRLTCQHCGKKLRGVYRNPHRADPKAERQLGYECQTKHEDGIRCEQSRVKANLLIAQMERYLKKLAPKVEPVDYGRYLAATESFVKAQKKSIRQDNSRLQHRKKQLKEEQQALLDKKTALVMAGEYSGTTKKHYDEQLKQVSAQMLDTKNDQQVERQQLEHKILTYELFMELLGNLHQYWASADYTKKGEIIKILASNLIAKDQKLRSVSWNPVFAEVAKRPSVSDGARDGTFMEPYLMQCWKALDRLDGEAQQQLATQLKDLHKIMLSGKWKY